MIDWIIGGGIIAILIAIFFVLLLILWTVLPFIIMSAADKQRKQLDEMIMILTEIYRK